jgi:hypothetical protein
MISALVVVVKNTNIAMAIKTAFFAALCIVTTTFLSGQNERVYEDSDVKKVMEHYRSVFKNRPFIEGWRVQIISTTDRNAMEIMRINAANLYPNLPLKWEHNSPYFRIKLGAFQTKLQATAALQLIKKDYPTAYLVIDKKIEPKEIFESTFP